MDKFLEIETLHIRITKTTLSMDKIEEEMKKLSSGMYLIAHEKKGKKGEHFHIVIQTQKTKKELTTVIKLKFELSGNKEYSVTIVRNKNQVIKYLLKDDDTTRSQGLSEEVLELMKKCSNKKGVKNLMEELNVLEEKYLGFELGTESFGIAFIKLKISYGQNLYGNHIKAYLKKMELKKNPDRITGYYRDLMR